MFHKEESPISDHTHWTMNTMNMREEHNCDMKTEEHLYRIGLFAQINRVSVKTLRFYEKQGLLIPVKIDEETGYRYYTMSQMSELHRILALKEAGLTLEDIKKLTMCPNETNFIHQKKNEILAKIADLTLQLSRLEGYLASDSSTLSNPVMVKTIPAVMCACMQSEITSYDELFDLMPAMGTEMEAAECICAQPEYCFTNYLDAWDRKEDEKFTIETCEAVTQKKQDTEKLKFREFPEIEAACIYHKGSYATLSEAYRAVLQYIEKNHYEINGSIRENYIDGVWNKDNAEDWLTEIQVPIRKKSR